MQALSLHTVSVEAEGKPIVSDVSFDVPEGSVSVLMGPNGSGKSTLVNALMGHPHYAVTNGTLELNGEDILSLPVEKKAQQGLFLSLQHIPKVGGINLATFLHKVHVAQTGEESDVLEYYLELRERAKEYNIPEELLDRPLTAGLSGGEKKLSEVLQLASIKPTYAVLDEIDSGVDVDAMKKVFAAITTLKEQGTGFLIISHHPALLDHLHPEHVHVMANGRLMKSGGEEVAREVLESGFCKAIDCPLEPGCEGKQ